MKLSKTNLQQIIQEELKAVLNEVDDDNAIPKGIKRQRSRYLPSEREKPIPNPDARRPEKEEGKGKKDITTNKPGKDGPKKSGGWVDSAKKRVAAKEKVATKEDPTNEELQRVIQEELQAVLSEKGQAWRELPPNHPKRLAIRKDYLQKKAASEDAEALRLMDLLQYGDAVVAPTIDALETADDIQYHDDPDYNF